MEALSFYLSGKTAHFKKPDVNSALYFTYNHIHKIALLGILGAIIGIDGYEGQRGAKYPEFYKKLENLKVSIIPIGDDYRGVFSKKIQRFNNSTGFASDEDGGNLIVKEQWLEDPKWQIIILIDSLKDKNIKDKLKDYILNYKCCNIPYLGKNDHIADINNPKLIKIKKAKNPKKIDSLFYLDKVELIENTDDIIDIFGVEYKPDFVFKDYMPTSLNIHNMYEFDKIAYSNMNITKNDVDIFEFEDKFISFI